MADNEKKLKMYWHVWTIEYHIGNEVGRYKFESLYPKGNFYHLKGDVPFISYKESEIKTVHIPLKYVDKIVISRGEKTKEFDINDSWGQSGIVYLDY